ncbi:metallophosphoesterase [Paenibacillus sp. J5C_2022]|nr:metallophosphoesterase [Paenibacillus sp. J5C2022]
MRHNDEDTITLLYTSDAHGHWARADGQSGGSLACAAQYAANIRKVRKHVWMIDNGDLLQGTPLASYIAMHEGERGAKMIGDLLRASGVDIAIPGNHDFDYGLPYLRAIIASSSCMWLAANVRHRSGIGLAEGYHIGVSGTRRIAFIGVTTQVPSWQYPNRLEGWQWHDEVDAVQAIADKLRPCVDAIVVCCHGGVEQGDVLEPENAALRIAREVKGIDVLLTGHQHDRFVRREGKTLILQPGSHGGSIGEVTLTFDGANKEGMVSEGRIVDLTEQEESAEVVTEVLAVRKLAEAQLGKVLCDCDANLQLHDWRDLTRREHPLVEWLHRVQLKESRAQLSAVAYVGEKPLAGLLERDAGSQRMLQIDFTSNWEIIGRNEDDDSCSEGDSQGGGL